MEAPDLPIEERDADERTALRQMLEYQRAVFQRKISGLSIEQLRTSMAPTGMTLAGLLGHMAFVEDYWFDHITAGNPPGAPWNTADWDGDEDWEWTDAATQTAAVLEQRYADAVSRSLAIEASVTPADSVVIKPRTGPTAAVRWVYLHMIGEYARHNGHADLLRQSVDGAVGD